jgi:hypothetical protein
MYQEETYESNDDEAREAAQLADEQDRFEAEAGEAHARLWAGTAAVDYRAIAIGLARSLAAESKKEAA